jgi:ATP-dependent DNA helicase RecQ
MGVDKPNIRFTIHNGMPSSREAFYQEAGRAGRDDMQSDCILLSYENEKKYDDKIRKFFSPQTTIADMKLIQDELKWKTSVSTNIFFITKDLEEPEVEAKRTLNLFNLLASSDKYEYIINIKRSKNGNEKNETEKYLYILHKLGVINNWSVKYNGFRSIDFIVEISRKFNDIDHIKSHALKYMNSYTVDKYQTETIKKVESLEDLSVIILTIRTWYYNTFVTGRREQLSNMYQFLNKYKNGDNSEKIQEELDQFFDLTPLLGQTDDGYQLTFDEDSLSDVIRYALEYDEDDLYGRQITLESLLESYSNSKINLYTGLINLRVGEYLSNQNGKERFELALSKLEVDELNEVIESLINNYDQLLSNQKVQIINSLQKYDSNFTQKLNNRIDNCEVLLGINCLEINKLLSKHMEG